MLSVCKVNGTGKSQVCQKEKRVGLKPENILRWIGKYKPLKYSNIEIMLDMLLNKNQNPKIYIQLFWSCSIFYLL